MLQCVQLESLEIVHAQLDALEIERSLLDI
jgi:hypothetical protein